MCSDTDDVAFLTCAAWSSLILCSLSIFWVLGLTYTNEELCLYRCVIVISDQPNILDVAFVEGFNNMRQRDARDSAGIPLGPARDPQSSGTIVDSSSPSFSLHPHGCRLFSSGSWAPAVLRSLIKRSSIIVQLCRLINPPAIMFPPVYPRGLLASPHFFPSSSWWSQVLSFALTFVSSSSTSSTSFTCCPFPSCYSLHFFWRLGYTTRSLIYLRSFFLYRDAENVPPPSVSLALLS